MSLDDELLRKGDDIIDREAKKLISKGHQFVSRNEAAFSRLFGESELNRLYHFAFQYTFRRYELLEIKNRKGFDELARKIADEVALDIMLMYRNLGVQRREDFSVTFVEGVALDKYIIENEKKRLY